jgi:integrase
MTTIAATVVEQFAADYFVMEGLTPGRQKLILRELRALEAHAGAPADTLDDRALRAYLNTQLSDGLHVNTVRRNLSAIKPFYRWCWRERLLDAERWMRISDVKPPRGATGQGRPRPYKLAEIERFWSELDARWPADPPPENILRRYLRGTSPYRRVWRHAMHLQTQAVVSLALFGGLRRAEIRLAGIDEIHPDNAFIVVSNGKGGRGGRQGFREVPYTEEGRRMVGEWLEFREKYLRPAHDSPWLVITANASPNSRIPSHPLNPISDDGFENVLLAVGAWELHRFRHTCATEWLRAGIPIERVSKLLGHAKIHQTLGYAELVSDDVARDVRRAEADFQTAVGRRNRYTARGA